MHPIFIPSKNRPKASTILKAIEQNIPVTIVIEPQDVMAYRSAYPTIMRSFLVLPEDNKGISYVRNFIRDYTENNNIAYFWMLDDDIQNFYHREEAKMVKDDFQVLELAEQQFMKAGVALAALEYQQIAWSATKDMVFNSFCDVCVWVDNSKVFGLRYRPYVEGKEDRDFAMQVVKHGEQTARTTLYAFAAPKNGSNAGGLKETFYDIDGREEVCVARMVELWGEDVCVGFTKENGRKDVKIRWDKINSPQTSLF